MVSNERKTYIQKKLIFLQEFIVNATSAAQREIYQGYYDKFAKELPRSKQKKEIIEKLRLELKKLDPDVTIENGINNYK